MTEQPGTSSDKYVMSYHTSETVKAYWGRFEPILLKGKEVWGEYETISSLYENFEKGVIQLWSLSVGPVVKLLAVSRIEQYPSGRREMVIQYIMGEGFFTDLEEMGKFSETFDTFARLNQCTSIRINANRAISRALKNMGFEEETVLCRKDIVPRERMN